MEQETLEWLKSLEGKIRGQQMQIGIQMKMIQNIVDFIGEITKEIDDINKTEKKQS